MRQRRWKVLMVYPRFPPSFWGFNETIRMAGKRAIMPPTGLATVAAMLPPEYFEVLPIIDCNVEPLLDRDLQKADMVMLSAMIVQRDSMREIIARAKRLGKKVVVGGPYATSYSEQVLEMGADNIVAGEAELTLEHFVHDLLVGRAERLYTEESVRSRTTVPLNIESKPAITATPLPRWDLLKLSRYASAAIQFSRGCPFHCEFCDIIVLNGHKSRAKTSEQMTAELDALYQAGWRGSVFIVDDNFIGNKDAVRGLLPALIAWQKKMRYPFHFFTEASVDLGNHNHHDILAMMVEAGFTNVFAGIETPDEKSLLQMGKGQNRGDLAGKIKTIQAAGLEVLGGFIVGSDGDKPDIFESMFRFIQDNGIVIAMAGLLSVVRQTGLWKRLQTEGRLRGDTSGNNTHRFSLNFHPKLDEQFLINGYIDLLQKLYDPANYYARCRVLRQRRGEYRHAHRADRGGITAALRVLWRNIFVRREPEFVRYLWEVLTTAPQDLSEMLTQAVELEHFRLITKGAVLAHHYPSLLDQLLARFQEQLTALSGGWNQRRRALAKLEQRFQAEAIRIWRSIPKDFRAGVAGVLHEWRDRLAKLAAEHHPTVRAAT